MISIGIILVPAFLVFLVLVGTITVYFFAYKRNINKALVDRDSVKRRMPPPYKVLIAATAIIVGTVILICAMRIGTSGNGVELEDRYFNAKYDFRVYQPEEMIGYLSVYSMEENAGYKKSVEEVGDVRVTYFLSEDGYDTFHPSFIAFVEYIGEKPVLSYGYEGDYVTPDDVNICGKGAAGSDVEDYFVIIGSASIECTFKLDIYYYDTYDKGDEMSDGAVVTETVRITID